MPQESTQSKSDQFLVLGCSMVGLVIGMVLMQPFRLGLMEAVALGAMLGGLGAGLGAMAGQAIVRAMNPARPPAESEAVENLPAAIDPRPTAQQPIPAILVSEADADLTGEEYVQLVPLDDEWKAPSAPAGSTLKPALASACLAGAGAVAAAVYATLIVWHWTAWGILLACLALIAASLAKFVVYQKQNRDRKTTASEVWVYPGLAANVVSLLLIACGSTAAVVATTMAAKRHSPPQPSFNANPQSSPNTGPQVPQKSPTDQEKLAQIHIRQAEESRRLAEAARQQKEEEEAAFKPQWRPLPDKDRPQGWTDVPPVAANASRRDLVRWKATENGFRITSLTMPQGFSSGREANRCTWSGDGQRLYIAGGGNYLMEISVADWTVQRQAYLWPTPESICFCDRWLVLVRDVSGRNSMKLQVLIVDPDTFAPAWQLDLPAEFAIRAASGAAGSKYLFAVDSAGQSLMAFDLGVLAPPGGRREAKLTRIPIPHPRSPAGLHQLGVTPDGKTVVYHEQKYLALLAVGNGTFTLQGPFQGPHGSADDVRVSANSRSLTYRVLADSRTSRGAWKIQDLPLPQEPGMTFPIERRCSAPDVDPVTGAILKSDDRLFSVLDREGTVERTLRLDDAVENAENDFQRSREKDHSPTGPSIESGIFAHPQGHRCLVWGDLWAVWLEWDDE
jgi:hypothetical protein